MGVISQEKKLESIINKQQQFDRRKRKKELSKHSRHSSVCGTGKSGYKKTTKQFDSLA